LTRALRRSFAGLLPCDPFLEHYSAEAGEVGMAGETAVDKVVDKVADIVVAAGSLGGKMVDILAPTAA
jgi:hypothetical protein